MRIERFSSALVVLATLLLLSSCAPIKGGPAFSPVDLKAKMAPGGYVQKVDNFLVILDGSGTMSRGTGAEPALYGNKFELAKGIVSNMNQTIPNDLKVKGGMRVFGVGDRLVYGMTDYSRAGLAAAINSAEGPDGLTPLGKAISSASKDLAASTGKIALIIVSDGIDNPGTAMPAPLAEQPLALAEKMKAQYGERICIYTILVGHDQDGKELMEQLAKAGGCGFGVNAEEIVPADTMADYVKKVFLTGVAKAEAAPLSIMEPIKEKVTIRLAVEFDFDKSVVKTQYHDHLKSVADFLKKYPNVKATIEGHTDSVGTDSYNQGLSRRRATSVKKYLVDNFGIDAARLTATGYGESRPIATNDTPEGRQKNRRVMAEFSPAAE